MANYLKLKGGTEHISVLATSGIALRIELTLAEPWAANTSGGWIRILSSNSGSSYVAQKADNTRTGVSFNGTQVNGIAVPLTTPISAIAGDIVQLSVASGFVQGPLLVMGSASGSLPGGLKTLQIKNTANTVLHSYDFNRTSGLTVPDDVGGATLELVGFAGDDSQWVSDAPAGPTLSGKLKRRNGVPVIDTSGLVITVSTAQGGASIIPASTISTNATGDWTFTNPDALAYATTYWVTIAKADGSETFTGKLSTQADPGV